MAKATDITRDDVDAAMGMARDFEACHHHFLDGTDAKGALYGLTDPFQPEMSIGWNADGGFAIMSGGEAHRAAGEAVKGVLLFLNCRSRTIEFQ